MKRPDLPLTALLDHLVTNGAMYMEPGHHRSSLRAIRAGYVTTIHVAFSGARHYGLSRNYMRVTPKGVAKLLRMKKVRRLKRWDAGDLFKKETP